MSSPSSSEKEKNITSCAKQPRTLCLIACIGIEIIDEKLHNNIWAWLSIHLTQSNILPKFKLMNIPKRPSRTYVYRELRKFMASEGFCKDIDALVCVLDSHVLGDQVSAEVLYQHLRKQNITFHIYPICENDTYTTGLPRMELVQE